MDVARSLEPLKLSSRHELTKHGCHHMLYSEQSKLPNQFMIFFYYHLSHLFFFLAKSILIQYVPLSSGVLLLLYHTVFVLVYLSQTIKKIINVMFGALGSISDQNFYMCMQNVLSLAKC